MKKFFKCIVEQFVNLFSVYPQKVVVTCVDKKKSLSFGGISYSLILRTKETNEIIQLLVNIDDYYKFDIGKEVEMILYKNSDGSWCDRSY